MKRLKLAFTVFVFVVLSLSLGSCRKDWTCECTVNGKVSSTMTITNITKKTAQENCDKTQASYSPASGEDCHLK